MDGFQEPYYSLKSLQRLKSLCSMLRNNADEILAAKLSVTIASNTLYELNEAVDNLQDGLSPPSLSLEVDNGNHGNQSGNRASDLEEWNFHLQLVLDIISKAPVLVLYKPMDYVTPAVESSPSHSSTAASQPLRLGYFTSLGHLEICCVPIQSIQDLLKMRERLKTFVVVNCPSSNFHLQDVLEMCDQEVSVPMQWAVLKHLCVRSNNLQELDGSLRLCPRLELLDLSKNSLKTTDLYLGYLMELTHLDLSHNGLTALPSVSATAKKKLRTLNLARNNISSLQGLEEMTSLQELDISENLVASHLCLQPVKGLHRMDRLSMKGCPAAMKKDHRILALQFISTVSLSRKFLLDGHYVTHKEIQNSRAVISHTEPPRLRPQNPQTPASPRRSVDGSDRLSRLTRSEEEQPSTAEDLTVSVTSIRKKKGRKKAKTRTMDIPDMDLSGGDMSSKDVTPSTTPRAASRLETLAQLRRQEVQETRAEMENLRKYYGENWLQAVDDQGLLPRPASVVNTTSDDATLRKSQTIRKSGTDVAMVADRESVTTKVDIHTDESVSKINGKLGASSSTVGERASTEVKSALKEQDGEERIFKRDDLFLSSSSGAEDGGASDAPSRVLDKHSVQNDPVCPDEASDKVKDTTLKDEDVGDDRRDTLEVSMDSERSSETSQESTPLSPLYKAQNTSGAHDTTIEPEEQGDPFIVSLPGREDDPFIITVSPRYLVEKDINGAMKEKLDLQSLEAVRMDKKGLTNGKVPDSDSSTESDLAEVRIILEFSSIRKDCRSRVYVMEDLITAQHLQELVQPFVDAKVEAARKKQEARHQCLKCSSQFQRGEATTIVYRESIPHTGSIRDFASVADIGGRKEVLQCPKCQSDHVILMESEVPRLAGAVSSSPPTEGVPQSAFLRKQSLDQLTRSGTPKAQSTPKKHSGSGSESHLSQSLDRRGSRSDSSRALFAISDGDRGQRGDRANAYPAVSMLESTGLAKQEEEALPSRRRSNAFYDQSSAVDACHHSDAVSSEILERRASSSATDPYHDMTETQPCATDSVTSADIVDGSQLATFGALNNLYLSASANSFDGTPTRAVSSSVDSDIAILNKRDSSASVVVLSSQLTSDVSLTDSQQDSTAAWDPNKPMCPSSSRSDVLLKLEETSETETGSEAVDRSLLTPVQQEPESVEVTPMGSPLSQSICSSMVSSVYNNSLLPNTSASDVFVSANEYNTTADSELAHSDEENEMSIYDQGVPLIVRRSSHKLSVSSEVEVISVEEGEGSIAVCEDNTISFTSAAEGERSEGEGAGHTSIISGLEGSDFRHLDHNVALYLMMNVFDNNEEFKFKVKTCVCQYMMLEEYEALVAVTNLKLYILRVNTEDASVELSEGLTLMEAQPHAELKRVDVGLGHQTLRLEFVSDCSSYTLVMRDMVKVDSFAEMLRDQLQTYSEETGVPSSVVFSEGADQDTLDTLSLDVLNKGSDTQQPLLLYRLGSIARGHNPQYPIAFVVSTSEVCLVKTNHQWPSPQYQTRVTVDSVGKQFTVLERQKINNIATVEVNESKQHRLRITFFNESSGDETRWVISMETSQGVTDFIQAVREPWEKEFGVQMDVESSSFNLSF